MPIFKLMCAAHTKELPSSHAFLSITQNRRDLHYKQLVTNVYGVFVPT